MRIDQNQQIHIEDVPITTLASIYGTPTYVYEENTIRENYQRAYKTFKKYYDNFQFYYAIKSCSNPAIVRILLQEGAGIDAASINEILLAKHLGIDGEKILFSGNFLSDEDIEQGVKSNVVFNADDISLLPRILRFGLPKIISFRINPGYGRSNVGEFVTNAGPKAKFGIHPDQVLDAYRQSAAAGIKRFGAHMMPGSCINDPEYFAYITELLMDIIGKVGKELGIHFEFIDLGGGLGIPYEPDEKPLDIEETARQITDVFTKKLHDYSLPPPRLVMEPGRYFVGNAGYVIGKVHSIKKSYSEIVGTDIGMNTIARPAMYNAYHHILVNGKENEAKKPLGLCGQICENTDYWVKDRLLPKSIQEGDIIVVENAGAYGFCMSYPYNGRLRPAEVLVHGTNHELIRERETFATMISGTSIPERLAIAP